MQCDEVIWQVVNQSFCSYKVKTTSQNFCRNEYNVTGLCNRQSCPLANSNYATIKEENGICYLYTKTIERAHSPAKMWERIKLSKSYTEALKQIDSRLEYWPMFLKHKCKQRLTKITQYLMKMRKLALKTQPKLIGIKKKLERRETKKELKAEVAARLEQSIELELLNRLKRGAYGGMYEDIVNINKKAFEAVIDEMEENQEEEEKEIEYEMEDDVEFVEAPSDDDDDDINDIESEMYSDFSGIDDDECTNSKVQISYEE